MKRKLIFLIFAALLLSPWPVAYAHDDAATGQSPIQIEAAEPAMAPKLHAFRHAIGSITPGDLFYIDTRQSAADIPITLHITNIGELVHRYRYLTLNIGVYAQTDTGQWQKVTASSGEPIPDTYITMSNGKVSFTLPGYAECKVTIDKGCFYYYGAGAGGGGVFPTFYLTAG